MNIRINLKVFLFLVLLIFTGQIKIYLLIMFFALLHEIGHILAGLILGLRPEAVSIIPSGFCVKFKTNYDDYNVKIKNASKISLKKLIIAMAGPLVNVIILIASYIYIEVTKNMTVFNFQINEIIYSNFLILIFNLLPIYPLDGGRILKEMFNMMYGIITSYELINKISNITIILLTILTSIFILQYHNFAVIVVLTYLWLIVIKENRQYSLKKKYYNLLKQS